MSKVAKVRASYEMCGRKSCAAVSTRCIITIRRSVTIVCASYCKSEKDKDDCSTGKVHLHLHIFKLTRISRAKTNASKLLLAVCGVH